VSLGASFTNAEVERRPRVTGRMLPSRPSSTTTLQLCLDNLRGFDTANVPKVLKLEESAESLTIVPGTEGREAGVWILESNAKSYFVPLTPKPANTSTSVIDLLLENVVGLKTKHYRVSRPGSSDFTLTLAVDSDGQQTFGYSPSTALSANPIRARQVASEELRESLLDAVRAKVRSFNPAVTPESVWNPDLIPQEAPDRMNRQAQEGPTALDISQRSQKSTKYQERRKELSEVLEECRKTLASVPGADPTREAIEETARILNINSHRKPTPNDPGDSQRTRTAI